MSLLFTASTRYLMRHRAQCALAISGIALGVAIVIAIQTTQLSARAAFARSLDSLFGHATHHIEPLDQDFDERVLARVRIIAPHWQPTPWLEGTLPYADAPHTRSLRLVGFDPLSISGGEVSADVDVSALLLTPGAALINRATATRLGVGRGDRIGVRTPAGAAELVIIAVLDAPAGGARALADDVALVDLATAQEVLQRAGKLTRIELTRSTAGTDDKTLARLRAALPPALELVDRARNRASAAQLTRAFYTNLDALSLLALLVGGFMIYNTMAFLVVQRQTLFARLRALGVTRSALASQIAGEALVLGLLGGTIGGLLGFALAAMLAGPMAQTLSDHYFTGTLARIGFSTPLFVAGLVIAVLSSLAASAVPAWQAANIAPARLGRASAQEDAAHALVRMCARAGLVCAAVALLLLAFSSRSLYAGFAALGAVLLAATLISPRLVQQLLGWCGARTPRRLPLPERLALKSASRSMGRIGLAIAALMAATATSVGVGLMVASFRTSLGDWLDQLLRADLYISQVVEQSTAARIDDEMITRLHADPRVENLSRVRRARVRFDDQEIRLTAYDLPQAARRGFDFIDGDVAAVWAAWDDGDSVIVSEPFAWHHRIEPGAVLALPTPTGVRNMTVTGIYTDYGSERGVVAISWRNFTRDWGDSAAHGVGVYARPGVDLSALKHDLEALIDPSEALAVWSRAELQAQSLTVFDRTFRITDVLTLCAALIAALGVFNALLALNLERAREYAMLRANGCSRMFIRRSLYAQTAIVGGAAIVFAIPLGVVIALLLIEIINVRSFGWSMALSWHLPAVVGPCLLAFAGALGATVYPAERTARSAPARFLRDE